MSEKKASSQSWKREPFTTGEPIPYHEHFTREEFEVLQQGLLPTSMEDKWFVYFEDPHLFLHRSWTGKPVYRVELTSDPESISVKQALCVPDVVQPTGAANQAKLLDFLISNLLLKKSKPFPQQPGVGKQAGDLIQHVVSGTGYPQKKI